MWLAIILNLFKHFMHRKPGSKSLFGRSKSRWDDNIKIYFWFAGTCMWLAVILNLFKHFMHRNV